jgi:hypothetical protein
MAQFIPINQNNPLALTAVNVRDLLFQLERVVNEVVRPMEQIVQDDNTYAQLAVELGIESSGDALAFYNLMLEVRNRLATAEDGIGQSAFVQYMSRIARQSP